MFGPMPRQLALLIALAALPRTHALAQCPDGTPPPCRTASARSRAAAPTSVAVLPFDNRSPDASDSYLAEGMTDEIANQLSRLGRLQVRARPLVDAQWRRTPDVLETARRLSVAWVVHGYVRHAGAQLLVYVELIRVATGEEAWGTRFPRPSADVFAVQAEVAESVAVAVGGRLSPGERAVLARRPTRNNDAYRLHLLGNSLLSRRTAEETERAIAAYTEATRLDPSFGAAWARIALARTAQTGFGYSALPRDSILALGWDAVRRALAIDSNSAETRLAEGAMAAESQDLGRAHERLLQAVRLDSTNDEAWAQLGVVYGYVLDSARSERAMRRALELNPDRRLSWLYLYLVRFYFGHVREAGAVLDTLRALGPWGPAFSRTAEVRFLLGDGAGAIAAHDERERIEGRQSPFERARLLIATGDSAPARAQLALVRAQADSGGAVHAAMARMAMSLGLREEALAALERMGPELTIQSRWIGVHDPLFTPLHSDPRFQRLLEAARPRVPWQ